MAVESAQLDLEKKRPASSDDDAERSVEVARRLFERATPQPVNRDRTIAS